MFEYSRPGCGLLLCKPGVCVCVWAPLSRPFNLISWSSTFNSNLSSPLDKHTSIEVSFLFLGWMLPEEEKRRRRRPTGEVQQIEASNNTKGCGQGYLYWFAWSIVRLIGLGPGQTRIYQIAWPGWWCCQHLPVCLGATPLGVSIPNVIISDALS